MAILKKIVIPPNTHSGMIFDGVVDGFEAFLLAKLSAEIAQDKPLVYVVRDGTKMAYLQQALNFIEPNLSVFQFPAWDCLPYDRVSPGIAITVRRLSAFAHMSDLRKNPRFSIILTTVNTVIQKLPPCAIIDDQIIHVRIGQCMDMTYLIHYLEHNGFERVATVCDIGEFAVRGGIIDIFSPSYTEPFRLDFFGQTLETIRVFDRETQRTIANKTELFLQPMSEITLTPE
ncbi:MAG: transcription-repair coupling factor, partial [Bartonella sp.]|nr:transcription-repair coupling factor [Bartonella sp.]